MHTADEERQVEKLLRKVLVMFLDAFLFWEHDRVDYSHDGRREDKSHQFNSDRVRDHEVILISADVVG